jgi:anaerobic selenocysteine-containing dehydrogenase
MFMGAIGSASFYTAATVDNAPVLLAAELVTGNPMMNPVWEPSEPGLLILVGTNPVVSHGYGTTLADPVRFLHNYRTSGGRIWVLDPRRTETAAHADGYLAVVPGSDVAVLAALVREVLDSGADQNELERYCTPADVAVLTEAVAPFTIERAAAIADVPAEELHRLVADIRANPGRMAMFCGTGTTMARDGVLADWLRWVLLIITGSLDRQGGMRFNQGVVMQPQPPRSPAAGPIPGPASRPELPRVAGQIPAVAMVDEIEAGNLRALIVTGGNPLSAFPEPDRVRAALTKLDALVAIDVADNELTRLATHVLPATGQLERADLSLAEHVAMRSGMQYTEAVLPPVAERRPVWWMLGELAFRMGRDMLGGVDPDQLSDESFLRRLLGHGPLDADAVVAAGPSGLMVEPNYGWVHDTMLPDGRWGLAPPVLIDRLAHWRDPEPGLVVIPRRTMGWSNSVEFVADTSPIARVHPETAAGHEGLVSIRSAHGELDAELLLDERVRPGVISLTHGHGGASPGRLTSSTVDVDPLTTMPWASGFPVELVDRPATDR